MYEIDTILAGLFLILIEFEWNQSPLCISIFFHWTDNVHGLLCPLAGLSKCKGLNDSGTCNSL